MTKNLAVEDVKKQQEPANVAADKPAPEKLDTSRKTTGEKGYDVFQFLVGKVWIMFFTAVIAFAAHPRYGQDKYFGIPNLFKKFQIKFDDVVLHNRLKLGERTFQKKILPLGEMNEPVRRVGHAISDSMILMWGGNIFAPVMKWLENSKEGISNYFNRKFGKPGEEEIAHERLKDIPKQTWGDIVKGRMAGFAIVFSSFTLIDQILNKSKKTNQWRFDWYQEVVGRWMGGLTKKGREMGIGLPKKTGIPLHQPLAGAAAENGMYRFGKIVALDIYATSAAILIWNWVSRALAKGRKHTGKNTPEEAAGAASPTPETAMNASQAPQFTDAIRPRDARTEMAAKAKGEGSYTDMIAQQELEKAAVTSLSP